MKDINYQVEQFADIRVLRYFIPNFNKLPLKKKEFIYYLSEATLWGRDITWEQNNEYNLWLRHCLDIIYNHVDKKAKSFEKLELYYKRVLFANGIHHHYSTDKFEPEFTLAELTNWVGQLSEKLISDLKCISAHELIQKLSKIIFNNNFISKRVCQDTNKDLILHSANNFYKNLTQKEAEGFYNSIIDKNDDEPVSYGLNSRLVKQENVITEELYCVDGRCTKTIKRIVYWLQKAAGVCETEQQKKLINKLCNYYQCGDLKLFDEYSIEWLKEQSGEVDFINGFIEVYGDPLGYKASWEGLVNIVDIDETQKASLISDNAQWFEEHSPVRSAHKKEIVNGVSMKVINAIMLGGDCFPASPLGINLPNAEWIREKHGSKSVSLQNISQSYEMASLSSGVIEEFAFSAKEIELHKKYGAIADNLHTHLHECVGHGSGKLEPGVRSDDLKAYGSVIEEARADLFGLYFIADKKMLELNLVPDMDVYKVQYNAYIRNGLMVQLARIKRGSNIEQAHMRNRQLIANWVFESGLQSAVIKKICQNKKTYFVVSDYQKLRLLFAQLLEEVQRIKSQGDYTAAKLLVETYGVTVDYEIHMEVLDRYSKLNIAPYSGFINPQLSPVMDTSGEIGDVKISYHESFLEQMERYNRDYSVEEPGACR